MSLSQFVPGLLASLALSLSALAPAQAQTPYLTNGSEYAIAGSLPGDQSWPRLSLSSTGGFLVWQDNSVDGDGFGIRAVGLDSSLARAQKPFRVNLVGKFDQEKPQVALLKDGGAVFVWQGGRLGSQKIYARFLSADNNWTTPDLLVSSVTNRSLAMPAVATLENGNIVIAWHSFNQRGDSSLHDIYAQILSPAGNKVGGEFAVNQFSLFNQRTPAIAALPSGGFVAAWVSDQQRRSLESPDSNTTFSPTNQLTVDIVARVFDANGLPVASEFLVNSDNTVCSNPQVAANADGAYVIVWSERQFSANTNRFTTGLDISARSYSANGLGGPVRRVNTQLRGNQFAPQVKAVRNEFLVTWHTVAGGSYETSARFLQSDSTPLGAELRVDTSVHPSLPLAWEEDLNRQFLPAIGADPAGRFLTVWSRFGSAQESLDLRAQCFTATDYVPVTATTNYAGPLIDPWATNGLGGYVGIPRLEFPASSGGTSTEPLTNGFALAKGYYKGLFVDAEGVNASSSGFFSMAAAAGGTYSARLVLNGLSYGFSGRFNSSGLATRTVTLASGGRLTVSLQLDLAGGNQVRGTITSPVWGAELLADRTVYSLANPYPLAGAYNVIIPPISDQLSTPQGSGLAYVTITKAGVVTLSATLADGTKVTQGSAVSPQSFWPLYAAPYSGRGLNVSWVQVNTNGVSGDFVWIKPRVATGFYRVGFTNEYALEGARYTPPAAGSRVVSWPTAFGQLILENGPLSQPVSSPVILNQSNRLLDANARPMNITISLASGWFYGTYRNPATGQSFPVQGRLLQNSSRGYGFFRDSSKVGQLYLGPITP